MKTVFYTGLILGSLVFAPEYFHDGFEIPKLFFVQLTAILLFALLILRKKEFCLPREALPLLALFLLAVISIGWSHNKGLALERLFHVSSLSVWMFFAYLLYRGKDIKAPLYIVVFIGGTLAVGALALDWIVPLRNWVYPHFLEINATGTRVVDHYRMLTSNQGNPNFLFHVLVLTTPLTVGALLSERRVKVSVCLSLVLLAELICFCGSQNRSGIISVVFAFMLIALFKRDVILKHRKKFVVLVLGLIVLAVSFVDFGSWKTRFSNLGNLKNIDVYSRVVFLETGKEMITDDPLLGKGIGQFVIHYPKYKTEKHWEAFKFLAPEIQTWQEIPRQAHNEYLQVLIELGVVGFLALVAFWVFFFVRVVKNIKAQSCLIVGAIAGVVGFLFNSLFTFPMQTVTSGILFWTVCGLLLVNGRDFKVKISKVCWIVLPLFVVLLWGSIRILQANYVFFDAVKRHAHELEYSLERSQEAAEILPYSFKMQYVAGWIARLNNKSELAAWRYEIAVENAPYFPVPYPYLINYYRAKGDYIREVETLHRYRESYAPARKP